MAETDRREQQKERAMSQQQGQTVTTTAAIRGRDTSEPDAARQAELRAAYDANVAASKPPYETVPIRTLGELQWNLRERDWSVDFDLPEGKQRPDLRGASLTGADLSGADLFRVDLSGADLRSANLSDATLSSANLSGADLRAASLDRTTLLNNATLAGASLDQIILDNTNLTVLKWGHVALLGDERLARAVKDDKGKPKNRDTRIAEFEAAVRANRVLAVALRAQGMSDDADLFAYHAQVLQRQLSFRQRQYGRWLFSRLLAALSGYGYHLGNIFRAYALVVLVFAAGFLIPPLVTSGALPSGQDALNAVQISLNAIHGRVFFAQFALDTAQSWLATAESVVGIVIEGVFVAMLIQRLFR
jgi:hypothetical protein